MTSIRPSRSHDFWYLNCLIAIFLIAAPALSMGSTAQKAVKKNLVKKTKIAPKTVALGPLYATRPEA